MTYPLVDTKSNKIDAESDAVRLLQYIWVNGWPHRVVTLGCKPGYIGEHLHLETIPTEVALQSVNPLETTRRASYWDGDIVRPTW